MKTGKFSNFRLEKLYLDCIDEKGNCFIIYRADLQFFFIKITYSSLVFSDSTNITTEKSSLANTGNPGSHELLILDNILLHITGRWLRVENPLPVFCFKNNNNHELIWNCHHPKALTEIAYNGSTFRGYGYGETLSLGIVPRDIPIDELRWGRFLSDKYTITWINWKGNHPVNKLFCNGMEYNDSLFEEERLIFGGGEFVLFFNEISIIRKGKLSNLFSKIPFMKIFFSTRILNTLENKYKAKSLLCRNQEISACGWSLYEIAIWKK